AHSLLTETAINTLKSTGGIKQVGPYLAKSDFVPKFPEKWIEPIQTVIDELRMQKLQPMAWEDLIDKQQLPDGMQGDLKHYLLQQNLAYRLDEARLVHQDALLGSVRALFQE